MITYIKTLIITLLIGLSIICFILWKSNGILREEKTQLQIELNVTKTQLEEEIKLKSKIQEYNKELSTTLNTYRIEAQTLQQKLSKMELSANKISKKHPKLLSNAINKATKKTNECFEKISRGESCEDD